MAGKERSDTRSLKGMFSTRTQRSRVPTATTTTADIAQQNNRRSSEDTPEDRPEPQPQRQSKPTQVIKPSSDRVTRESPLSPLGSLVMREARREIGSDSTMQQQLVSAAKTELVIAQAVDRVLRKRGDALDDLERENVIITLQKDLVGWGVLQPLIDNKEVTDIHVYDYRTVVLQRGKISETTGLSWPSKQAYQTFIDRLLLRLGKSLSTQQHTVDASFPDGVRLCAVH